ncbi:TIGR03943 family protein [Streptomyces durbertensis]|uniref:TIGR03943 family protein n=1 Tax=Streptomyces durbertensis TaxID=2448886 RepID=A0ABR6EMW7_9ACTN|nr:TIGR03943 family protein [Streptomyces durbertensis]MBB1246240.1 TIGR03943 family protein [Streptomyces durbertensis]
MRRTVQTLLLMLAGASVLHISLFSELYLNYVTAGFRPLLILSGILLLLLGLGAAGRDGFPLASRGAPEEHEDDDGHHGHGHDHSRGPRVAWLLFLPVLALLFYPPPPLGAYSAARSGDAPVAAPEGMGPLPKGDPLPMSLTQFSVRALYDGDRALEGRTVRLTGFVTPADGDGWDLTRHLVRCCAADSRTLRARVHGAPAPPADSWVTVTGRWRPVGEVGTDTAGVALDVDEVVTVPRPADPYRDVPPDGDAG